MKSPSRFRVNGRAVEVGAAPGSRLTLVLRDHLGMTGTKVGCDAGDCGACTVLLDGEQVCACLVPLGQVVGRSVTTVEGLADDGRASRLQQAFHEHGAAQCGICTPGMLMAASTLLDRSPPPAEPEVLDALGGVLCRCTGYRKIVQAVLAATNGAPSSAPSATPNATPSAGSQDGGRDATGTMRYVGRRLPGVDGPGKVTGRALFGADASARRRAAAARGALSVPARALHHRRLLRTPRTPSRTGARLHRRRRTGGQRLRHLSRRQGSAGARAGHRPLSRRGGRGAGRGRGHAGPDHRRSDPHRLGAAPGTRRPARRHRPGRRRGPAGISGQRARPRARAHRRGAAGRRPRADRGERRIRDPVHRARLHRARGGIRAAYRGRSHRGVGLHADAVHGPGRSGQRARHRARSGTHPAVGMRRRLRRQAGPVRPAPDGAGGVGARGAGAVHVHATGVHGRHHQAASVASARPRGGRAGRTPARLGARRRLRHRRLRIVGPDRRRPGPGALHGSVPGAERAGGFARDPHQLAAVGRIPRFRRAAGRRGARDPDRRACNRVAHRPARAPASQCAADRRPHRHRPGAGGERGARRLPGRAAAALEGASRGGRRVQRRGRESGPGGAAPGSPACGTDAATPRCRTRPRCG